MKRERGLMIGLELNEPAQPIRSRLLTNHKIFTGASAQKNTIRLLPPLSIGKKEADCLIDALRTELIKKEEE